MKRVSFRKKGSIEKPFENFLGTGNLPSKTGLGLMQNKGLTIMAENINRYFVTPHAKMSNESSHYRRLNITTERPNTCK